MITLIDISAAVSRVLSRYDVREAYLFGSFARGEQTPDSDIDLRLVCGDSMTFGTLYELSLELEEELGRERRKVHYLYRYRLRRHALGAESSGAYASQRRRVV